MRYLAGGFTAARACAARPRRRAQVSASNRVVGGTGACARGAGRTGRAPIPARSAVAGVRSAVHACTGAGPHDRAHVRCAAGTAARAGRAGCTCRAGGRARPAMRTIRGQRDAGARRGAAHIREAARALAAPRDAYVIRERAGVTAGEAVVRVGLQVRAGRAAVIRRRGQTLAGPVTALRAGEHAGAGISAGAAVCRIGRKINALGRGRRSA